ncbi:MAG: UDP-N-acetylmuramoyl-tripeptide--D-alanyl-D-alanine ligase [Candidatus Paraimprobicoccus trichonymphae]|uniref:UDP-N-acetylmuramoyl-tripeptide--D-alanyl-D-alanine ligase n=1 Tax=Candidatus Paraimprobicoccus trichonymphae TaxID=3033793 RepID=A0AA48I3V1_9FIRM|nr:MAG: UDP-N-acetylmuramoyl-tripeptide--D-alanyl-D-alanine ligase [Candidatus Paraimprobicoccus trichonymphae]
MEELNLKEIILYTNGNLINLNNLDADICIKNICIDSREVTKNSLFVPIVGEKVNPHKFINKINFAASLFQKGQEFNFDFENKILIEVENTEKALQDIAKFYRKKFDIPIVGVTGSVGKTTTKEMIASVLSENLKVLKSKLNNNSQVGVALSIFKINLEHQVAVLEMGVSEIGEMERLAEIVDANCAVVTNIGLSHIENFENVENTKNEKLKILKNKSGRYYLNGDIPGLSENIDLENVIYFGLNGNYAYRAEDIFINNVYTKFTLITENYRENITIPCIGVHNVYNSLIAIAVASDFGMHIEDIKSGLKKYTGVPMRQEITNLKNNIVLIDDSYNSSPESVKSSINVLRNLKSIGKNIIIFGDILELGEKSSKIHYDLGKYIALEEIDLVIATGENSKHLINGIEETRKNDLETIYFNSVEEINNTILNKISYGDKILVKGSRGIKMDRVVNFIKKSYQ